MIDWSPVEAPEPRELTGRYVSLRPVAAADAEALFAVSQDPAIWTLPALWALRIGRGAARATGGGRALARPALLRDRPRRDAAGDRFVSPDRHGKRHDRDWAHLVRPPATAHGRRHRGGLPARQARDGRAGLPALR